MYLREFLSACGNDYNSIKLWKCLGEDDKFQRNPDYIYTDIKQISNNILDKRVICWYLTDNKNLCVTI